MNQPTIRERAEKLVLAVMDHPQLREQNVEILVAELRAVAERCCEIVDPDKGEGNKERFRTAQEIRREFGLDETKTEV